MACAQPRVKLQLEVALAYQTSKIDDAISTLVFLPSFPLMFPEWIPAVKGGEDVVILLK